MADARVVDLCFHGIGRPGRELEPGEDRYWITPETYAHALDLAAEHPHVRLSFDDANASDLIEGLPGLLERGLSATFYVLAGRLDTPGSLSSAGVRELAGAGMEIGTHGWDHVGWRGLDAAGCRRELVEARARIEDVVGAPVRRAALPLGRYDRRTLARVRGLGYASLATSDRAPARDDAFLQPRFSVRADDTAESLRRVVTEPVPLARRARTLAVGAYKRWR